MHVHSLPLLELSTAWIAKYALKYAGRHSAHKRALYEIVTHVCGVVQGVAFAGPALCMLACAALTPPGASHVAGSLAPGVTAAIVALLSVSFALGAWARAGLYCNHQVLCQ